MEPSNRKIELTYEEINKISEQKEIELCREDLLAGFEDLPEDQECYFAKFGIMDNEEKISDMAQRMWAYMRNLGMSFVDARDEIYLEEAHICQKADTLYGDLHRDGGKRPIDIYNPIQQQYISSDGAGKLLIFNVAPDDNNSIEEILNTAANRKEQLMNPDDISIDDSPEAFYEAVASNCNGWGAAENKINLRSNPPKTTAELKALCKDESVYLGDIDTSLITDMSDLFAHSTRKDFRGIETWDTSKVTNMSGMFFKADRFNHPVSNWNTSNVTNMAFMFEGAKTFNQPIGGWDVRNVENMSWMFFGAEKFNQDLNGWKLNPNAIRKDMFLVCPIKAKFKPVKHKEKAVAR